MTKLPSDYAERTYAGVLGKIIGVYLGRPVEHWSHERIAREFGEVRYYLDRHFGRPLVIPDDDITGTFTFFRAFTDNHCRPDLSPRQIGETWLNYILERQTILWWGGIGISTEHTAWHRLNTGVPAPDSGSARLNGRVVSEQIGAQIFIDAWGLLNPGDPARAADFARRAASVSHDGEAVYAAQVVAALVAAAFAEKDVPRLIDLAVAQIPPDCLIRRLIEDLRSWHAAAPADWRATLRQIHAQYGCDKYGGGCHIVPNHALIHLALLHSGGDFSLGQTIVNTAGWDTDCNAGNVGCILGVAGGLAAFDRGLDWRGPVGDRLLLPTAEGGRTVTDAVQESIVIVNAAHSERNLPAFAPKGGARFHFSLPGSTQGFAVESDHGQSAILQCANAALAGVESTRALALSYQPNGRKMARVSTETFIDPHRFSFGNYALVACPTLYSGQTVRARVMADDTNESTVAVRLCLTTLPSDHAGNGTRSPATAIAPGQETLLTWRIPPTDGSPIARIGLELESADERPGKVWLDWLDWKHAPDELSLEPSTRGDDWKHTWVKAVDAFERDLESNVIVVRQGSGLGLVAQGTRDWQNYEFSATLRSHQAKNVGIGVRVQGLRRYYALLFSDDGKAKLVKRHEGIEHVLGEARSPLVPAQPHRLTLRASGPRLTALVDGHLFLEATDPSDPFTGGASAIAIEQGTATVAEPIVRAVD